jgi:hypothetical protein
MDYQAGKGTYCKFLFFRLILLLPLYFPIRGIGDEALKVYSIKENFRTPKKVQLTYLPIQGIKTLSVLFNYQKLYITEN